MKIIKITSIFISLFILVSCGSQVVPVEESKKNGNQAQSPYEPTNTIPVEEKSISLKFPISNFESNEKAYLALKNEYAKKGHLTGEEVNRILSKEGEESLQLNIAESFYGNPVENKIDWRIEENSYWPERKVGKLRLVKYEAPKNNYGRISSVNLENNIKKYAKETLGTKIGESNEVRIIPLSEDICFVDVSNYISIIRLDSDNSVLRSWGEREMWPDFSKYEGYKDLDPPYGGARLFGIYDVNFDGNMDFVFQFLHSLGAHSISATLRIFTINNNELFEVLIGGLSQIEDFVGISKNGNILIACHNMGVVHSFDGYWMNEASRIEISHQFEVRKDGFIYDVTYKYTFENLEALYKNIHYDDEANSFTFAHLIKFDILGLSALGQKRYLENPHVVTDKKEIELVKDLIKNNKPFHMMNCDEILKKWECLECF